MKSLLLGLGFWLVVLVLPAAAQVQKFPYEAGLTGEDVYVRSGPGKKYYPTGKLKSGDHVIVHRHDPGGWYMISPPTGSFSFVQADALKPLGNGRALVVGNNVPVLVGSSLGESRDIEQVRLSTNDQVQLADEQMVAGPGGTAFYRIIPPRGEYRWILGQFVIPVNELLRRQHDKDPFATPSHAKPAPSADVAAQPKAKETAVNGVPEIDESAAGFQSAAAKAVPPAAAAPAAEKAADAAPTDEGLRMKARELLADYDRHMREMIEADMSVWNLEPLDQAYRELQKVAPSPVMAQQINLRLASIDHYRKLKAEYDDFVQLTSQTTRRDSELAARLGGPTSDVSVSQSAPVSTTVTARPAFGPQPRATTPPQGQLAGRPGTTLIDSPQGMIPGAGNVPVTEPSSGPAVLQAPMNVPPATIDPNAAGAFQPPVVQPPAGQPPAEAAPAATLEPAGPLTRSTSAPLPRGTLPRTTLPGAVPPAAINQAVVSPQPFPPAAATPSTAGAVPNFIGAGLVQKTRPIAPGAPQHVLITPQGKVLAFLDPQAGVNLDQYVGQAVGIHGDRARRADLRAEIISVQSLTPVRLR